MQNWLFLQQMQMDAELKTLLTKQDTLEALAGMQISMAFDEVYDKVTENSPQAETIVADAAYKTPHICKKSFGDVRVLSTAYKRPQATKGGHEWLKYVYDEFLRLRDLARIPAAEIQYNKP